MAEDLPDPPDGWTVSTATATHIAVCFADGDGRSLVVRPSDPPDSDRWTVKGLAGYGPPYPVFVDGVEREDALDEAWAVMEAVAAGESATPVRTETAAKGNIGEDSEDNESDTEADANGAETDDGETEADDGDQADLTAFADDDE